MVLGTEIKQNSSGNLNLNPCLLFFLSQGGTGVRSSVLQVGKWMFREGKFLAQGFTAKQKPEPSLSSGQL